MTDRRRRAEQRANDHGLPALYITNAGRMAIASPTPSAMRNHPKLRLGAWFRFELADHYKDRYNRKRSRHGHG